MIQSLHEMVHNTPICLKEVHIKKKLYTGSHRTEGRFA